MEALRQMLKDIGDKNGLEISLDESGSCTLELSDGRVLLIQERVGLDELDFVATLGTVPEEKRAAVFTDLLAANFYWNETYGATISWNVDLEEAVIMYPVRTTRSSSPRSRRRWRTSTQSTKRPTCSTFPLRLRR
jgi:hypothetical protein